MPRDRLECGNGYVNNDIARYEGYYASVFYSYLAALGYEITVEDSSGAGRLDMAVRTGGQVYLGRRLTACQPPQQRMGVSRRIRTLTSPSG